MGTDDTARETSSRFDQASRVNEQDREAWNARLSQRRQERRQARLRKVAANNHGTPVSDTRSGITSPTAAGANSTMLQSSSTHHQTHSNNSNPASSISITPARSGVSQFSKNTGRPRLHRQGRRRSPAAVWLVRIGSCFAVSLVMLWMVGMAYVTTTTGGGTTNIRNPMIRTGLRKPLTSSDEVIDMRQLVQTMKFDNPDGGAWKQGWDVTPVSLDPKNPLQVYVIPHSHCDPGWIKTFDDYFQTQTKEILTTVIQSLAKDSRRKFIWAEISYFEWWWREQDESTRHLVRKLLHDRQFEFVTGGWVQPDEANTQLYAMEIQLQEGHDFIRATFGEEYIPKYGWSIDPFGYSPTMAYLLKKYNFRAMLIQRVHYAVKKELALHLQLEFLWRQTWDTTGEHDIFTHVMPFYSYDVPHTCGPDPSVCCQFDFARLPHARNSRVGACPWNKQPREINSQNVAERAMLILDQYRKKANLYRSQNVVLVPLGDDFRWQQMREADAQYENYQQIFDYINQNVEGVQIQWGTLSEYFDRVAGPTPTFDPPLLKGSFFTYADRDQDYWSGYFTSRIFDKALDRKLERVLYAASALGATKEELQTPRRALSLFQHHDGVTGTAKPKVVEDYAQRIHSAIQFTQDWISKKIYSKLLQDGKQGRTIANLAPCWQSNAPRGLSQNLCPDASTVIVYNPLETEQSCGNVIVKGRSLAEAVLPCEVPGPVTPQLSDDPNRFQFDPVTGLMTHPIQEEWMVWKVNAGGAYLFFPGKLEHYEGRDHHGQLGSPAVVEDGGYVVRTDHWKRTLVEKIVPPSDDSASTNTIVLDFVYETFLQNPNEEWFVRFSGDVVNDGVFHTDLNGYNFDTHKFRKDMPIQSQVFPMPTLASIEDAHQRMTVLSEHAQGTASIQDGSIDVWLDRRLVQDDARGLGEGVRDNVPTRTRLRVVLERDGYYRPDSYPEFEITPLCKRLWKELNHPLEVFGSPSIIMEAGQIAPKSSEGHGNENMNRHHLNFIESAKRISEKLNPVSSTGVGGSASIHQYKYFVPVVYMVFNRVDYLKRSIDTLRRSDFPRDSVPVVISHDGHIDEMVSFVESLKSEFHIVQIFHPYACSEHPHSFPGDDPKLNENYRGDTYGNPREGKVTCCKHHFTWMMNQVFEEKHWKSLDTKDQAALKRADAFLFLEEDYIVAPTIYSTIQSGIKLTNEGDNKGKYFGIVLDPSEAFTLPIEQLPKNVWSIRHFVSGPMVLGREMFQEIKANSELYCTFDDYNWDWTIVHLMTQKLIPSLVLCPTELQVAHVGLEGMHGEGKGINHAVAFRIKNTNELAPFTGTELLPNTKGRVHPHYKGYGGWGHPADHDHCLELFNGRRTGIAGSLKNILGFS